MLFKIPLTRVLFCLGLVDVKLCLCIGQRLFVSLELGGGIRFGHCFSIGVGFCLGCCCGLLFCCFSIGVGFCLGFCCGLLFCCFSIGVGFCLSVCCGLLFCCFGIGLSLCVSFVSRGDNILTAYR